MKNKKIITFEKIAASLDIYALMILVFGFPVYPMLFVRATSIQVLFESMFVFSAIFALYHYLMTKGGYSRKMVAFTNIFLSFVLFAGYIGIYMIGDHKLAPSLLVLQAFSILVINHNKRFAELSTSFNTKAITRLLLASLSGFVVNIVFLKEIVITQVLLSLILFLIAASNAKVYLSYEFDLRKLNLMNAKVKDKELLKTHKRNNLIFDTLSVISIGYMLAKIFFRDKGTGLEFSFLFGVATSFFLTMFNLADVNKNIRKMLYVCMLSPIALIVTERFLGIGSEYTQFIRVFTLMLTASSIMGVRRIDTFESLRHRPLADIILIKREMLPYSLALGTFILMMTTFSMPTIAYYFSMLAPILMIIVAENSNSERDKYKEV